MLTQFMIILVYHMLSNFALMDYKRWLKNINSQHIRQASGPERKLRELFTPDVTPDRNLSSQKPEFPASQTIHNDLPENIQRQLLRIQKKRRKISRHIAQYEKKIQFPEENGHNFFAAAENKSFYGGL